MQNPIQKFRRNSIVFEKPGILSEKLKTLTSSNYHRVQYFLLKLRTRFLLTRAPTTIEFNFFYAETSHTLPNYQYVQKGVRDSFLFCLALELFVKIKSI